MLRLKIITQNCAIHCVWLNSPIMRNGDIYFMIRHHWCKNDVGISIWLFDKTIKIFCEIFHCPRGFNTEITKVRQQWTYKYLRHRWKTSKLIFKICPTCRINSSFLTMAARSLGTMWSFILAWRKCKICGDNTMFHRCTKPAFLLSWDQAWAIQINGTIDRMVILVPSKLHFLYRSNYLTVFGQTFLSNLFSQSFTNENDSKVKNRRT